MKRILFSLYVLLEIICSSCYNNTRPHHDNNAITCCVDTIFINSSVHDTVLIKSHIYIERVITDTVRDTIQKTVYEIIPEIGILNKKETEIELKFLMATGNFNTNPTNDIMPTLSVENDMELLPYMISLFSQDKVLPHSYYDYIEDFIQLCTSKIQDENLFKFGEFITKKATQNLPQGHIYADIKYPTKYKQDKNYKAEYSLIENNIYNIDSLRIYTLAHNSRRALTFLEKYYREKNEESKIAIYYKVLLCYEGNGDLAERFYRVLSPELKRNPQLNNTVREVLVRAAICDHNTRAQELCDSLGFSLCDNRLPLFK